MSEPHQRTSLTAESWHKTTTVASPTKTPRPPHGNNTTVDNRGARQQAKDFTTSSTSNASTNPRSASSTPSISKGASSTTKHIRHVEENKRDRRRKQNNESSRRSRERKRLELEALQKARVADQLRITHLQGLVQQLSHELRQHDHQAYSRMFPAVDRAGSEVEEQRPGWFGAAF